MVFFFSVADESTNSNKGKSGRLFSATIFVREKVSDYFLPLYLEAYFVREKSVRLFFCHAEYEHIFLN